MDILFLLDPVLGAARLRPDGRLPLGAADAPVRRPGARGRADPRATTPTLTAIKVRERKVRPTLAVALRPRSLEDGDRPARRRRHAPAAATACGRAALRGRRGAPVHARGGALGRGRHGGRRPDRRPARLAAAQLRRALAQLRAPPAAAHQRRHLRLRRLRPDGEQPVRRAAHLAGGPLPAEARLVRVLGLAGGDRRRGDLAAARLHPGQGIRRARVADRAPDRGRLGRLRDRLLRHDRHPQGAPHLRRELVLRRLHHRRRPAAHRQRRGDPGRLDEELLGLRRRAGRDGPVVVRPQRGRLLPHRRLPRDDVLLHPEAGRAADLLVPPLDRPLLGPDLHLHVGRARTTCTTPPCPTGRSRSAWCSRWCCWRRAGAE